ncbi:hypothetical protein BGZ96_008688 [Linnemannia gamsii]|uniref:C2H2-type domain-containing protein n=1 Tax=Linnemannia gamsii TaxID=64522 RepID=A0ABQ7JXW8_9FUNG|nr:hypothetical protein BGZ96_008688 [Linnemannia gamsii]
MFPSTYTLGNRAQDTVTLRREPTDEISKMFTTIFDGDSFFHTTPTSSMSNLVFTPMSPASPTSSCFSSSGNDTETEFDSVYSSPAITLTPFPSTSAANTSIDPAMTVDHMDEDSVEYPDLFSGMENFSNNTTSEDIAAVVAAATGVYQYSAAEQEYHSKQNQDQDDNDDDDAMSTYSSSSSLSSAPSSRACSPETFPSTTSGTATTTTNTTIATASEDGATTTITNPKDGSIMCFNRTTGQMSFRCDLCPPPTSDQHPQSFGRIHDLKRHQATKHATPEGGCAKTWPCEFCEKPFARRDALLRHYSVKAQKEDGVHPTTEEVNVLAAVRARAKLI